MRGLAGPLHALSDVFSMFGGKPSPSSAVPQIPFQTLFIKIHFSCFCCILSEKSFSVHYFTVQRHEVQMGIRIKKIKLFMNNCSLEGPEGS